MIPKPWFVFLIISIWPQSELIGRLDLVGFELGLTKTQHRWRLLEGIRTEFERKTLVHRSLVCPCSRHTCRTHRRVSLDGCVEQEWVRGLHGRWMENDSFSSFMHRDKIGDSTLVLCFSRKRRNRILLPALNQHFGLDLDSEWHRDQIIDKEETFLLPCRAGNGFLVLGFLFWVCGRHHFLSLFFFFSLSPYL